MMIKLRVAITTILVVERIIKIGEGIGRKRKADSTMTTCSNDHLDYAKNYKDITDPRYFSDAYYATHACAVRCCALCHQVFKDGKGFTTVHVCQNAFKRKDGCIHAVCEKCMDHCRIERGLARSGQLAAGYPATRR
jgi:hypothetical protein